MLHTTLRIQCCSRLLSTLNILSIILRETNQQTNNHQESSPRAPIEVIKPPIALNIVPPFFLLFPFVVQDSPTALTVTFGSGEDENIAKYTEGQLDQLSLAYAITIHKSQGSEYPVVVLPVMARDNRFSQRRALLYTAMTRAKRLLVCVGEETGLHKAQSNCGINDDGESPDCGDAIRHSLLVFIVYRHRRIVPKFSEYGGDANAICDRAY